MSASKGPPPRKRDDEAAIVEKLLKQLPEADPTLSGKGPAQSGGPPRSGNETRVAYRVVSERDPRAAWWRVILGAVIAAALPFWPYVAECGFRLSLYLAAVVVVLAAGLWGAWVSWRERVGVAHVIALVVVGWTGALAAREVLPRVGYASSEAAWRCRAHTPAATAPSVTPTASPVVVTDTAVPETDTAVPETDSLVQDSVPVP